MIRVAQQLLRDEAGFIVSGELILISTIVVLGLVVGLSEISNNLNQELEDVGSAFGSLDQTFSFQGNCGHKGRMAGSKFTDTPDMCDSSCDVRCDADPQGEGQSSH